MLNQLAHLLHLALRLPAVGALFTFQLSCTPVEMTPDGTGLPHVKLSRPVHFSSIDGQDAVLGPGLYRVESSDTSDLQVTESVSQTRFQLRAEPTTHLESLEHSVALTVPIGEDELHLLLLRPDKTGLEIVGTYSGVRSRASSFGPTTQLQISQAMTAHVQLAGAPLPPLLESPPPNQTLTTPRVTFVWRAASGQPSQTHYELCVTETGRSCADGVTYRWIEDAQRVAVPGNVLSSTSTGTPITGTRYEITLPPIFQSKPLEWLVRACAPGLLKPVVGGSPQIICTSSPPRRIIWAFTPPNLSRVAQYQSPFRPLFDWSTVPAAESYLFCMSRPGVACPSQPTDTAQTIVVSTDRYTTQYTPANDWELVRFAGRTTHWTAAACSSSTGCVYQNSVESLTLQPPSPSMIPNLDQPLSGSTNLGRRAGFKWTNVPNIQRYKLCVAPPGVDCGTSGSYEQFVFPPTVAPQIYAPDIYIPDRLTPDGTQTTLNWTVAACTDATRCAYQPAFRTITVSTMPVIRMVVFGDSVAWGQGLVEEKKFFSLIADRIGRLTGMPVTKKILAHSGATLIWRDTDGSGPTLHPEVPATYPTIDQQLGPPPDSETPGTIPNPLTVDLVLIGGCINDINVRTILNPTTISTLGLRQLITRYCHDAMKDFLRKVGQRFPSANIVVTGYYPILSPESSIDGYIAAMIGLGVYTLPALGLSTAILSTPGALPVIASALIAAGVFKNDVLDRAKLFHDDAKVALNNAVTEIGVELRAGQRFIFADAGYGRANAMFTDEDHTWVYALTLPGLSAEDAGTPPEQARRRECTTDLFVCHRASLGHPNEKGAQNYANAVIGKLSGRQLNPAQP